MRPPSEHAALARSRAVTLRTSLRSAEAGDSNQQSSRYNPCATSTVPPAFVGASLVNFTHCVAASPTVHGATIMTVSLDHPQPSWGAKINTYRTSSRGKDAVPDGCPPWATKLDVDHWQKRGLVIWEHCAQRLENLAAEEAVALSAILNLAENH